MFESKRTDGPPLSVVALELLGAAPYDSVVPYTAIADAIGGASVKRVQSLVQSIKQRLEKQHTKAVEAVPNTGYRIVKPSEHLRLARAQQSRSRRALTRAQSTVTHVDARQLTEGEYAAITVAATALAAQLTYMRQNDIRVGRVEKLAENLSDRVRALEEKQG
jgi:hypothetical protein